MPRRLGQHFLRPASVEKLLCGDRAGAATTCSWRSARAAARSRFRSPTRCARVVAVELDGALAGRLRARAPRQRRDRLRRRARDRSRGARPRGRPPGRATSPTTSRARCCGASSTCAAIVRDLHVMLQDEVARRVASPPGSKEYGILSVLYAALDGRRRSPRAFRPAPSTRRRRCTRPCSELAFATSPAHRLTIWAPSSAFSRGPSATAEERLKTTSEIAILTSRNTLGPSISRGHAEPRRYPLWSSQRSGGRWRERCRGRGSESSRGRRIEADPPRPARRPR